MDEFLSEQEQIEQIRGWWSKNRNYVYIAILFCGAVVFGNNTWKTNILNNQYEASTLFEELTEEVVQSDLEAGELIAGTIYSDFGDSIYAKQTRLVMARLYMDQGRDGKAEDELRKLLADNKNNEFQLIARHRLAKILLYQEKPQEVLSLLESHTNNAFQVPYNELIGDAYLQLGDFSAAETAYQIALQDTSAIPLVDSALIQMKIYDLPQQTIDDVLPQVNKEGERIQ